MTYGLRLDAAMKHAKKSRAELAEELGCVPQTIGVVITWKGEKDRSLSTAYHEHAARFLKVNPNWLATGEGDMLLESQPQLASKPQTDTPAPDAGSASATGMEIALLYDLIPVTDRVRRVKAYNAATKAILAVLEEQQATDPDGAGS